MTEINLYKQIVQKQEKYIVYLTHAVKTESLLRDITLGVRSKYEKELAELRQHLEESKELEIMTETTEVHSGWICPRCQKVHSWLSMTCDCEPKTMTWITQTPI